MGEGWTAANVRVGFSDSQPYSFNSYSGQLKPEGQRQKWGGWDGKAKVSHR